MLRQQGEAPGQGIGGGLVPGKDHRLHLLADLAVGAVAAVVEQRVEKVAFRFRALHPLPFSAAFVDEVEDEAVERAQGVADLAVAPDRQPARRRSEEHTSELQSLMRISYAVFGLQQQTKI